MFHLLHTSKCSYLLINLAWIDWFMHTLPASLIQSATSRWLAFDPGDKAATSLLNIPLW